MHSACGGQGQLAGVTSVPPPFHSQGLNSSGQTWQQVPLSEDSGWLMIYEHIPLLTKIRKTKQLVSGVMPEYGK